MIGKSTRRADLVAYAAEVTGYRPQYIRPAVTAIFEVLAGAFSKATAGNEVRLEIPGFGIFYTAIRKPKPMARNPRTGEITPVAARRTLLWKPLFRIASPTKGVDHAD